MRNLPLADRIAIVLSQCSEDPLLWPAELRSDCALIHARFEALKLDTSAADAWSRAKVEWVRSVIKRSGLMRVAYHFRNCPQPGL